MKRFKINTTVAKETKAGLTKIAKREKLTDHGLWSKGQAIDFLQEFYWRHQRCQDYPE